MRPERRRDGRPFRRRYVPEDQTVLPLEPIDDATTSAVAEVERRLTDAGRRARAEHGEAERPDPTFADALPERLVVRLPAETAEERTAVADDRLAPGWVVPPAPETSSRRARAISPAVPGDLAVGVVGLAPTAPMADAGRPQRVVCRLALTGPRLVTHLRWAVAMVAGVRRLCARVRSR